MLDVTASPQVVAFAPRLAKEALGEILPRQMTWTESGSYAGWICLVPLRSAVTWVEWAVPRESVGMSADPSP